MLEVILNSDIARLVLGYLREQCLGEASLVFCKTSPYLKEEYRSLKRGYRRVVLGPESLISIIREYCQIKSRVLQFLDTLSYDDKFDFLEQPSLDGKIVILLKKTKYKPADDLASRKHKRHHTSSDTEVTIIEGDELSQAKKRRLSNFFVSLDTSKDGPEPKSTTVSSGSENEALENTIPLEVPDFNDISEALLHNTEFPNKLADKINSVLASTDKNVPTSSVSCSTKNPQDNFEILSAELDNIIKSIVNTAENEPFFDELVEEVVHSKTSETKSNRMELCTPHKSKEFYRVNDGQCLSIKKPVTPCRNFTRATQTSGGTSFVNEQNVQQLTDIPSSTMKSDEFLNIRSTQINNENLNIFPTSNLQDLQKPRPNSEFSSHSLASTLKEAELLADGQLLGWESYEVPVFAEIIMDNGQLAYGPVEKPVTIDPRTGEINQIYITKRVSNDMFRVEFRPKPPVQTNVFIQQPVYTSNENQNRIHIISDEKLPTFPTDISLLIDPPLNNLLQSCNVNSATECLRLAALEHAETVQEPKLVSQSASQPNTGEKRSHVRTLNFTTPPKNERLLYEEMPLQNLNVPQSSGIVTAIQHPGVTLASTPQMEIVIPPVSCVPNNEIILMETPKIPDRGRLRRTRAPAKLQPKIEKKECIKKPPVKQAARKRKPTKKAPARKAPTKVTNSSKAVPVAVVSEIVEQTTLCSCVQEIIEATKIDAKRKIEVTNSEKAAVIEIDTERKSKTQEDKNAETLRQWKEMRAIPPKELDQHIRKVCSELEMKAKFQALISPNKIKKQKKKKAESKEKDPSKITVPDKLDDIVPEKSSETKEDPIVSTEKPEVQKDTNLEDVSTSTSQQDPKLDLPIIDTEIIVENEQLTPREKESKATEQNSTESVEKQCSEKASETIIDENAMQAENQCFEKLLKMSVDQYETQSEPLTISKPEILEATESEKPTDENQDTSLQRFQESFACQALLALETPLKFAEGSTIPKTPNIPTPGTLCTPLLSNITMQSNISLLKNPDAPTPIIAITPGRGLTLYERSGGSSHYSVRHTDYSTGSSYYKPDESDELDRKFDTMYHSERLKNKKEEVKEKTPPAEDKSSNRESCNSDDWSKSIDTVQTVIKAKKYESRLANKSNSSVESKDGSVITPCKLEKRLSKSDRSSTKSINKSMNSSSSSSSSSSSRSSSSSNTSKSSNSWCDVESAEVEQTKPNKPDEKKRQVASTSKSPKGKKVPKNHIATPKKVISPVRPVTAEVRTYPPAVNRASKVRVGAASHLPSLEEKRKRVAESLKHPNPPHERRKVTPIKSHHEKTPNPKQKTKNNRKLRSSDTPKRSGDTGSRSNVDKSPEKEEVKDENMPERRKSVLVTQIESSLAATPTKFAAGVLRDLMEKDLALTPSKDDMSADEEEVVFVVEETEIKEAVNHIKVHVGDPHVSIEQTPNNSVTDDKTKNEAENIDVKENVANVNESHSEETDEDEFEDPCDACEMVTIGEDDKLRHIRIVYKGKSGPPPPRSEKISIAHSVMNIFTDEEKHSLTVNDEVEMYKSDPVPKTKQIRKKATDSKKTASKKTVKDPTPAAPTTTSAPNKPKIKLLHKNKFNKPESDNAAPVKETAPKTDTKSSRMRNSRKPPPPPPPNETNGEGNKVYPLLTENLKIFMEQSKLETAPAIQSSDIDAVLSLLHPI